MEFRISDIIRKKRDGFALTKEEIEFFVRGCVDGSVPDYQAVALLMAIYFKGMESRETADLTLAIAHSGDMIDLSLIEGIKVDKHSTGGVGDKTTLVVAPVVAACGLRIAKMSGRGLGHTGGTVDKLESIPSMRTTLERNEFFDIVNRIGLCVIGQSENLAPADKKLYALRDVTATVDSIPLIAASIMGKKIAAGSDVILLDVKVGSGAFMKTVEQAEKLAEEMVSIGESVGLKTAALLTNMDEPLGNAIGNSLEVIEAVNTLKGAGPEDFTRLCIAVCANMLFLGGRGSLQECENMASDALYNGSALMKFIEMIRAQGGDTQVIYDTNKFKKAKYFVNITANESGYISKIETEKCGNAAVLLGAGRAEKDDAINYAAGIVLEQKIGDFVNRGDVIATMYADDIALFEPASKLLSSAVLITEDCPQMKNIVLGRIG
ncbi:MAG: pyrimidine-nucleoside phosphorylase [Clostridiales bacterium]|nr:pyrimidine-nucleoside phosphorylase [Clostridiales bacterium]